MAIEKIKEELCIACGTCVKVCPMDVIRLEGEEKKPEIKYPQDCITCFNCEMDCPEGAVEVAPERQHPEAIPIILPW